jgi:serine/threonine protein kinase
MVNGMVADERIRGRYLLRDRIGGSGPAGWWRADDQETGRTVAIRLLDAGTEPPSVTRLPEHPSLVPVYDNGAHEGRRYVVTGHVAGESLRDLVRRRSSWTSAR